MTSKAHESVKNEWFWPIAMVFLGVICLADYHYSISNQIPSDGPLRIGFPMTFYWMVCPMISAGTGACQRGISALGLIVDLTTCIAFAIIAATATMYFAENNLIKRKQFWISTGIESTYASMWGNHGVCSTWRLTCLLVLSSPF